MGTKMLGQARDKLSRFQKRNGVRRHSDKSIMTAPPPLRLSLSHDCDLINQTTVRTPPNGPNDTGGVCGVDHPKCTDYSYPSGEAEAGSAGEQPAKE